ncbi:MAG: redoxin family protein [Alphaproteobacteria bacterium]
MDVAQEKPKSLKPLIALNLVLASVLLYILLFLFGQYEPVREPVNKIPAFGMASAMHEGTFDNSVLTEDVFILNVFASWCKPCEAEHPFLKQLAETHNIPVYGIALKDQEDDLSAFLNRLGNPYRDIGLDNAGLMLPGLGIGGIPATFVADSNHNIYAIVQGPLSQGFVDDTILPAVDNIRNKAR